MVGPAGGRPALPIDPLLPEIVRAVAEAGCLVLEAPPGAGKTTRVPPALLERAAGGGEVWVLEPRRLAARLGARRVAEERGERLGATVGFQVRFDRVAGPDTRLRFVTQGVLLRRLLGEPSLAGIGAVVLDEFHERSLEGDTALALLSRLRRGARPDLRLVVMSATLEAEPVAALLGAPRLHAEGRRFDVALEYHSHPDERPLEAQVASAVGRLVAEGPAGDILVFLPGAAEIRRAREACAPVCARADRLLVTLHGDLPPEEQDRAVAPASRPKVILSTNVAETSVTIEGVVAVVDSGLARLASHAGWSGLPMLRVGKVSRASAAQRTGRAGRTGPGRCLRLYTRHDHDARPAHETPEIARADLSELVLALRGARLGDPAALGWLDPPPPPALEKAEALLRRLGALDPAGEPTPLGRRMLRFPLHPRLARLLCEAEARGAAELGAQVAALLGERGGLRPPPGAVTTGRSDVLAALEAADRSPYAERAARQLRRLCDRPAAPAADPEEAALLSLLAGFPDRVARRRARHGREVLLASGGAAWLDPASVVGEADLLVAVDAEERREPGRAGARLAVRAASAIEPEWLVELFPETLRQSRELVWNAQAERVEAVERLRYEALVLEERTLPPDDPNAAAALLRQAALSAGPAAFADPAALEQLLGRLDLAARAVPEAGFVAPAPDAAARALAVLCEGRRSFAELRQAGLAEALLAALSPAQRALLAELVPERIEIGGRAVRIGYRPGEPPVLAVRMQDLFGRAEGPRLLRGRVPLVLHLLAPNRRPVQVTTDLAGFWRATYPKVRRELMRRYPKHAWPEDPRTAAPAAPRRR